MIMMSADDCYQSTAVNADDPSQFTSSVLIICSNTHGQQLIIEARVSIYTLDSASAPSVLSSDIFHAGDISMMHGGPKVGM